MLEITPLGSPVMRLEHLVLDFNGTLAVDGVLIHGVAERIDRLAAHLTLHVVSGDTFRTARAALTNLACQLVVLPARDQAKAKRAYVERLGPAATACIGNGANDRLMMECASLAIAVIQPEGAAVATLQVAHIAVARVLDALDLLLNPLRLVATLRR